MHLCYNDNAIRKAPYFLSKGQHMVFRTLLLVFWGFAVCMAMEKSKESVHEAKLTLITRDNEHLSVPSFCIALCKHFKEMIEDFKDQSGQEHEIRFQSSAQDVKAVFNLLAIRQGHGEGNFQLKLQEHSLIDLARILALVNFLDCPTIFIDIVLELARKIDEVKYSEGHELWEQLEEILPRELQKMLQEIVLIQHEAMSCLGKVTHRIKDPTPYDEVSREYTGIVKDIKSSIDGRTLIIVANNKETDVIHVYDLSVLSIRKIGAFPIDVYEFSPDEKYIFCVKGSKITLINRETTKSFRIFASHGGVKPYFSKDSKMLFINDGRSWTAYCLETGFKIDDKEAEKQEVEKTNLPLAENLISQIRNQFPQLALSTPLNHYFSEDYTYMALIAPGREQGASIVLLFDVSRAEAITFLFSHATEANHCRIISQKGGVFLNMGKLLHGQVRYYALFYVDLRLKNNAIFKVENYPVFAYDKFAITWQRDLRLCYFLPTLCQWKMFDAGKLDTVYSVRSAGSDIQYLLLYAERFRENCFRDYIEKYYLPPLDLLCELCTLKELIVIIKHAADPLILHDPYYKNVYDNLHPDVRKFLDMKTIEEK